MNLSSTTSPLWLWSGPEASAALRTRNLAVILRTYRRIHGISQEQLAAIIGYDKTYISMIETGRRNITDVGTLRVISDRLAIPAHTVGISEYDDATFMAMLQFGESVLNLANVARQAGRAVDAIQELWPLVARLEARAVDGMIERDSLELLGRARLSLGVALGAVLPEERLSTAARWTGQALVIAERLGDSETVSHALTMHGNELRKAGHVSAAIARVQQALTFAKDLKARTAALAILARAAGETGDASLFDFHFEEYVRQLEEGDTGEMLANPLAVYEIRLRGLLSTGRAGDALQLLSEDAASPVAPQWGVIAQVTEAEVLLSSNEHDEAEKRYLRSFVEAERFRLPHQVQRAVRAAQLHLHYCVEEAGSQVLRRLSAREIELKQS